MPFASRLPTARVLKTAQRCRITLPSQRTAMSTVAQSINLASVNTHPDRAKRVIGAVIEGVKDRYPLVHAGNSTSA